MQDTVNVAAEDVESGKPHGHGQCPIARPFKGFAGPMRTLLPALLICLLAPTGHGTSVAQTSRPTEASAQSDAQKTAANSIIGTEGQFWEAMKNKDGKFFEANVPADLVTISMFGVLGKTAVIDLFFKMPCEVRSFTLTDFKVTFFTSETAFVTYKAATDGTCAGKAVPTVWASAVYVKRHERWLKLSHQETRAM